MLKLKVNVWLFALLCAPVFGSTVLFTGTFNTDDNVALIPFMVSANNLITVQSFGYAGGTTASFSVIPEGGFAPNAILFDSLGNEIVSDNGGHCGITGTDSVTGNCDDPYFQEDLSAGSYTLALVEWDNTTLDGFLPDGFKQDGNPGFTCGEFGGSGNFCDVTTALGTQRNGKYAVQISGASLVTPEPSTFLLIAFAGALTAASRRRRRSIS